MSNHCEQIDWCDIECDICHEGGFCDECDINIAHEANKEREYIEWVSGFHKSNGVIEINDTNTIGRGIVINLLKQFDGVQFVEYPWIDPTFIERKYPDVLCVIKHHMGYVVPTRYYYTKDMPLILVFGNYGYVCSPVVKREEDS